MALVDVLKSHGIRVKGNAVHCRDVARAKVIIAANQQLENVARQFGGVVLPDNPSHQNRIEIKSESSTRKYIVSQNKATGEWGCSCPGWCMKKAGQPRKCKHLTTMKKALEMAVPKKQLK